MTEVITYKNNPLQCFCQLKFASGERLLISIASVPTPSVKLRRLVFGGLIPRETIWEYSAATAGSEDAYVENLVAMFQEEATAGLHPLDAIRDALLPCDSIADVRESVAERASRPPTQ